MRKFCNRIVAILAMSMLVLGAAGVAQAENDGQLVFLGVDIGTDSNGDGTIDEEDDRIPALIDYQAETDPIAVSLAHTIPAELLSQVQQHHSFTLEAGRGGEHIKVWDSASRDTEIDTLQGKIHVLRRFPTFEDKITCQNVKTP